VADVTGPASGKSGRAEKTLVSRGAPPRHAQRNATKGAERAKQIMAVAEQLFHERGYADTSMDDIAKAAGLLKGSLYYYMDSKEDMLYRIAEEGQDALQSGIDAVNARHELSPIERVAEYVEAQVAFNVANMTKVAVYHTDWMRLDGDRLAEIVRRRNATEAAFTALLAEAQRAGEIPAEVNLKFATASAFGVIIWPYTWYRDQSVESNRLLLEDSEAALAELIAFVREFVLRGLGAVLNARR
jgi:AcrR family transcriptional regulator